MVHSEDAWDWVARARRGDDRAFTALMDRYKRPVLRFAYRLLGDAAEAEDVAQDVFVRLYRRLRRPGWRRTAAFSTWLFQVTRNAARDRLRKRGRHPVVALDTLAAAGREPAAAGRLPSAEVDNRALGRAIAAAVASLPEDQRTAIILFEYEGLDQARIAAVMRCSPKAVEARIYRARRTLRRKLAPWL